MNGISPQEERQFYKHLEQLGLRDSRGVERRGTSGYLWLNGRNSVAEYRSAHLALPPARPKRTIGYYYERLAALEALCASD
jgi:hypothetical protein